MNHAALGLLLLVLALPVTAADAVQRLLIAQQRPPCSEADDLPITPNDPASVYTPTGRRCYGTQPAMLELLLPVGYYVWLDDSAPNPAAWIDLGSVIVDPRSLEEPPLGLKVAAAEGEVLLELRWGDVATLTPLVVERWQEVNAPNGQRFWMQLERDGGSRSGDRSYGP